MAIRNSTFLPKGHPELFNDCSYDRWDEGQGPLLDATRNETFTFLSNLIQEIAELFKDEILYLGGDEFSDDCWYPQTMSHFSRLRPEVKNFFERIGKIVSNLTPKRTIMFWQEVLEMGATVPENSIINIWKKISDVAQSLPDAVQNQNVAVVISQPWYINYIAYGETWRKYYDFDISSFLSSTEKFVVDNFIGGEVCLWAEFVDATNFLQFAWPEAAAPAENLWTRREIIDHSHIGDTQARLNELRCRLILRKIPARPIQTSFCKVEWSY